jgi:hypothetical protein
MRANQKNSKVSSSKQIVKKGKESGRGHMVGMEMRIRRKILWWNAPGDAPAWDLVERGINKNGK